MIRLFIAPDFTNVDKGDGGIRRVVEAQKKYLPEFGIKIATTPKDSDIIAVHAGMWVKPPVGVPVVSHCHGLYWAEYEWHNWHHALNKDVIGAMRKADVVTATAKWVANILARGMLINAPVLYHGIEPEEWQPGTNEGYVLWNKTRVDSVCDPHPLNVLASMAPKQSFITTFGDERDNVRVTGALPYEQGKSIIQNAGVYLCTARETFGIGTLEAMACGVPVLGWNWGGQAEVIEHKVDGYLARPGDFDDLLVGLQFCIDNRVQLADAAREKVRSRFTWRNAMHRYADLYKGLVRQRSEAERPKVSVVIPCYNLQEYLPRAIASVRANKFTDYEIIVVDDASTVPVTVEGNDVRVIRNERNMYLAETLNRGIREAQGEYIIPLDADNELGPNALKVLANALDTDRDLDIVYGKMQVVESDGHSFVSQWPPREFDFRQQMQHRNQCPSTSMYRKRVWERIGGYRRRCRTAEDADFWCRASSYGFQPKRVTDAPTLIYYNRADSMSHVETDWGWHNWYSWGKYEHLTPFGAVVDDARVSVPTYEPAAISIVIPVGRGHERMVLDALDSLSSQTFLRWETIIVNATDVPLRDIPPFAKVIDIGHASTGKARNVGIKAARTPLIVLLDADDYLAATSLEKMYNAYKQHGGYVYTDWIVAEKNEVYNAPDWRCEDILQKMPHAVTCLFEKSAWENVNGFDESLVGWEDWDFFIRLVVAGNCGIRIPEPLFYYRTTTGTRRETAFANKEALKSVIYERWKPYIKGEKPLMACGSCGQRRVASSVVHSNGVATTSMVGHVTTTNEEMVLLEYFSAQEGTRTFKGPSGAMYKFGTDQGHKIRYVRKVDANYLMQNFAGKFKAANLQVATDDPVLVAAGPPQR